MSDVKLGLSLKSNGEIRLIHCGEEGEFEMVLNYSEARVLLDALPKYVKASRMVERGQPYNEVIHEFGLPLPFDQGLDSLLRGDWNE